MSTEAATQALEFTATQGVCATGERVAEDNRRAGRIPVLSCEGGCIRGEIARLAANAVAAEEGYARGCHGELLFVPESLQRFAASGAE